MTGYLVALLRHAADETRIALADLPDDKKRRPYPRLRERVQQPVRGYLEPLLVVDLQARFDVHPDSCLDAIVFFDIEAQNDLRRPVLELTAGAIGPDSSGLCCCCEHARILERGSGTNPTSYCGVTAPGSLHVRSEDEIDYLRA
jgi:hypothetical protein